MPCYRCGARQVDPDRGESPWKRGVRADRQVQRVLLADTRERTPQRLVHVDVCGAPVVHLAVQGL